MNKVIINGNGTKTLYRCEIEKSSQYREVLTEFIHDEIHEFVNIVECRTYGSSIFGLLKHDGSWVFITEDWAVLNERGQFEKQIAEIKQYHAKHSSVCVDRVEQSKIIASIQALEEKNKKSFLDKLLDFFF